MGRSYLVWGYKLPSFFTTCKTKDENISTRSLTKFIFWKMSNWSCHIETTEDSPFIKQILCPNFKIIFTNPSTLFIYIFNFLLIKIQKVILWNKIIDNRLKICPLPRFRFRNHVITNIANRNQLLIKKKKHHTQETINNHMHMKH